MVRTEPSLLTVNFVPKKLNKTVFIRHNSHNSQSCIAKHITETKLLSFWLSRQISKKRILHA